MLKDCGLARGRGMGPMCQSYIVDCRETVRYQSLGSILAVMYRLESKNPKDQSTVVGSQKG